jgi:hypothetical protein
VSVATVHVPTCICYVTSNYVLAAVLSDGCIIAVIIASVT